MQWTVVLVAVYFVVNCAAQQTHTTNALLSVCPHAYDEYNSLGNMCYKTVNESKTWTNGRLSCQTDGADLMVIRDWYAYLYIVERDSIWIGLEKSPGTSTCHWVDGNPYNDDGLRLPCGDGIDSFPISNQSCVKHDKSFPGFFGEEDCSSSANYVCENRPLITPLCLSGYTLDAARNKCVSLSVNQDVYVPWYDALSTCSSEGGGLVTIPDAASSKFVDRLVTNATIDYWIGVYRSMSTDFNFTWVDGNQIEYENWEQDISSSSYQPCVAAIPGGFRWSMRPCSENNGFVCEKDVARPSFCPGKNWIKNPTNYKCYKVNMNRLSWDRARQKCVQGGGDLVVIPDSVTKEYVKDLIASDIARIYRHQCWVGLTDPYRNNSFEWVDGSVQGISNTSMFDQSNHNCGLIQLRRGDCYYVDTSCRVKRVSISEKVSSTDYPILECPHGYITYIQKGRGQVLCFMAENTTPMTYSDARKTCESTGGHLYYIHYVTSDLLDFMSKNILVYDRWYWTSSYYGLCRRHLPFTTKRTRAYTQCNKNNYFVCRHRGNIKSIVNVKDIALGSEILLFNAEGGGPYRETIDNVCTFTALSNLTHDRRWAFTSEIITSATVHIALDILTEPKTNVRCFGKESEKPYCCSEVIFQNPVKLCETHVSVKMEFPAEKVFCLCPKVNATNAEMADVCSRNTTDGTTNIPAVTTTSPPPIEDPTPISQEAVQTLKNLTSSQHNNGSKPPNKLCPCGCDRVKFDPNPEPEALFKMLSKIEKELRVEPENLSTKRNKKISAGDSRAESQTIGYISLLLCFIPFCIIIGTDLIRVFQYVERKRNNNVSNTDEDSSQNKDSHEMDHFDGDKVAPEEGDGRPALSDALCGLEQNSPSSSIRDKHAPKLACLDMCEDDDECPS